MTADIYDFTKKTFSFLQELLALTLFQGFGRGYDYDKFGNFRGYNHPQGAKGAPVAVDRTKMAETKGQIGAIMSSPVMGPGPGGKGGAKDKFGNIKGGGKFGNIKGGKGMMNMPPVVMQANPILTGKGMMNMPPVVVQGMKGMISRSGVKAAPMASLMPSANALSLNANNMPNIMPGMMAGGMPMPGMPGMMAGGMAGGMPGLPPGMNPQLLQQAMQQMKGMNPAQMQQMMLQKGLNPAMMQQMMQQMQMQMQTMQGGMKGMGGKGLGMGGMPGMGMGGMPGMGMKG